MQKLFTSTVILVATQASTDKDLADFAIASTNCQKNDPAVNNFGKRQALRGYWMTSETQTGIQKGCQSLKAEEDKAKCTMEFESMQLASKNYASRAATQYNEVLCKAADASTACEAVCSL